MIHHQKAMLNQPLDFILIITTTVCIRTLKFFSSEQTYSHSFMLMAAIHLKELIVIHGLE